MLPPLHDSALALETHSLAAKTSVVLGAPEHDTLVYVAAGAGALSIDDERAILTPRSAGLVRAGETAELHATASLELVVATVGDADLHAPMGRRELAVSLDRANAQTATGARSFQILFGPHNGSTRATLFAGYVPPGKAPWHYHLYDEIVWIPEGPGRLHVGETTQELGPGAAFRLRPRQVHIVENPGESELTIIGIFTPAGSPSAAYLEHGSFEPSQRSHVAAEYRFAD